MKLTIALGVMLVLFAGRLEPSHGEAPDADRASTIKAGMVLNFIRYTEWPTDAFASDTSPIVIALLGDCDMNIYIEQAVKGQQVHGRALEVRRLAHPERVLEESAVFEDRLQEFRRQLRTSNVLFICDSEHRRLKTILQDLDRADVLTVSDMDRFAERGGMLGLAIRRDRIAFDANPEKIHETQLKVSSQLLRLAQTVESRGE